MTVRVNYLGGPDKPLSVARVYFLQQLLLGRNVIVGGHVTRGEIGNYLLFDNPSAIDGDAIEFRPNVQGPSFYPEPTLCEGRRVFVNGDLAIDDGSGVIYFSEVYRITIRNPDASDDWSDCQDNTSGPFE